MSAPTAAGAAAAAEYFLAGLYPYIYASGDLGEWDALSAPDCTFCNNMRTKITQMTNARERVDSAEVQVSDVTVTEQRTGEWFLVTARLEQEDSTRLDSDGDVLSVTPGGEVDAVVALSWDADWRVDQVDLTPIEG